ncbi:hypothetical protein Y1Q_0002464 [Alligator mississippiensis]|uniref:Uncharacterized protein n=1 Tax=Alligator mississippiensis TaxID=8496 RepID=A0A151NBE6_ALLMI|nr:hypothetical protein Y1Q_0002464 [Alligator mississippiensis]
MHTHLIRKGARKRLNFHPAALSYLCERGANYQQLRRLHRDSRRKVALQGNGGGQGTAILLMQSQEVVRAAWLLWERAKQSQCIRDL